MPPVHYALVAYVKAPVGEFVERLRGELHPALSHLPSHITVLPPRRLQGSEEEARQVVERVCRDASPFEVVMGEVETFIPVTPTVFIRVAHAAYRLRELHDQLNIQALQAEEPWPYMPHLTIVKVGTPEEAGSAFHVAEQRWSQYQGSRRVLIEELTFVREAPGNSWEDLAPVPLGGSLAVKRGR
jgi:2'-5' RNA ligase